MPILSCIKKPINILFELIMQQHFPLNHCLLASRYLKRKIAQTFHFRSQRTLMQQTIFTFFSTTYGSGFSTGISTCLTTSTGTGCGTGTCTWYGWGIGTLICWGTDTGTGCGIGIAYFLYIGISTRCCVSW